MTSIGNEIMHYTVLRAVGVRIRNHCLFLSAAKPRSVLALLMLHANEVVPKSVFLDELWGEDPPVSAHNTLQTYIFQIRKWLSRVLGIAPADVSNERLVTEPGGYRFCVPDQRQLDLGEFMFLAQEGEKEFASRNYADAVRLLNASLSLWSGHDTVEARPGGVLEAKFTHLRERRLRALEDRIEADLLLGRHREILGELSSLAIEHPLHESLHGKLMIALARSGRVPDALKAYQRLRTSLVEELGLEPSEQLRSLHQAVLAEDPRVRAEGEHELLELSTRPAG